MKMGRLNADEDKSMKHAANPVRPAALTDWLTMRQDTIRRTFYVTLACLAFLAAIGPTAF